MRLAQLFGQTLREAPAEAETASHQLLLRAGFIRPLGVGIFAFLPLGRRVMQKIEVLLREEMNRIGGQEISIPVVCHAAIGKQSGRRYQASAEMGRFRDRSDRDLALAMTHEEMVAVLTRQEIRSYRQLPCVLYHIQKEWRDDPPPRAGLIRVREFVVKDSYSLDADREGLEERYRAHYQAYFNLFRRCGLPVIAAKSNIGMMEENRAHEFIYLTPLGEETILLCDSCGYKANRQAARFRKPLAPAEEWKSVHKVPTPGCKSIEDLATFLGTPKSKTAKAVFFVATVLVGETVEQRFVFALIRGDMELNETKLANAIGARDLRPATEEEILAVGAIPGFASPIGLHLPEGALPGVKRAGLPLQIVVDDSIPVSPNLAAGANEEGYHLLNTNYGRDYGADVVADIALATEGCTCAQCDSPLRAEWGVEVGHIWQLGVRGSRRFGCTFLDRNGQKKPVVMGSYGIDVSRLLACIAEEHHDGHGLCWPAAVAPYLVHLVLLRGKGASQAEEVAERLYRALRDAGLEALYDDREESPGVKFHDADLIGLPVRLTVSERALAQGGIEMKLRRRAEKRLIPLESVVNEVYTILDSLQSEIESRVAPAPCED